MESLKSEVFRNKLIYHNNKNSNLNKQMQAKGKSLKWKRRGSRGLLKINYEKLTQTRKIYTDKKRSKSNIYRVI